MTQRKPPHVPHVALEEPNDIVRRLTQKVTVRDLVPVLALPIRNDPLAEADRLGLWVNVHGRRGDYGASVWASPERRGVGVGATAAEAVRRAIEDLEERHG